MSGIHQDLQYKEIQERINVLETGMGNMCSSFGRIARKNARLRDSSDLLVYVLNEYSNKEKINSSLRRGLVNYGGYLSAVEEYRTAMIDRIEKMVVQPISKYQEYLKSSRKTIKSTMIARDKEKQKQQKLSQLMQRQTGDGRNIAKAQANAENAAQDVTTQDKILAEQLDTLEMKKLNDIKNMLREYTNIQMIFHAKSVEMLSHAYKQLMAIDTESDLEEFRNNFARNVSSGKGALSQLAGNIADSRNSIFGGASSNSMPTTPRGRRQASGANRSLNTSDLSQDQGGSNSARRAKSNEAISARNNNQNSNRGGVSGAIGDAVSSYRSEPNLSRQKQQQQQKQQRQDIQVNDFSTDDSDDDY